MMTLIILINFKNPEQSLLYLICLLLTKKENVLILRDEVTPVILQHKRIDRTIRRRDHRNKPTYCSNTDLCLDKDILL